METITLSRSKLAAFLTCQRQFQLRFMERIAWPTLPLSQQVETAVTHGKQFHQLIEQHYLGLPIATHNPALGHWWTQFKNQAPALPEGEKLIETTLTIPITTPQSTRRTYLLNGRFDLLIIGQHSDGAPFAHIFDWKTGKPRTAADLQRDWQTRLYLAMLTEGGSALLPKTSQPLLPTNIQFTYWYVEAPEQPQTIRYTQSLHAKNWADLQTIVNQIDGLDDEQIWPLTDARDSCQQCAYQIICQRQTSGTAVSLFDEDETNLLEPEQLEPKRP